MEAGRQDTHPGVIKIADLARSLAVESRNSARAPGMYGNGGDGGGSCNRQHHNSSMWGKGVPIPPESMANDLTKFTAIILTRGESAFTTPGCWISRSVFLLLFFAGLL